MKTKKQYKFMWANGKEIVEGTSITDACKNIQTKPSKIITGFLVSTKEIRNPNDPQGKKGIYLTRFWDSEMFWKYLKKANKNANKPKSD